jgi:hypothetical protein
MDLPSLAFEAFAAAFDRAAADHVEQVRIATAFWSRLGDEEAGELAMEDIALAAVRNGNPAGLCCEHANEAGFSAEQITDAAIYAAR